MRLQHVALETHPDAVDACAAFFALLGFARVPAPGALGERSAWLQAPDGAQVHLLFADAPAVPAEGHLAVVAEDYDGLMAALRAAGHRVDPREEHWGSPRCFTWSPAGHRVEVMAAPPAA